MPRRWPIAEKKSIQTKAHREPFLPCAEPQPILYPRATSANGWKQTKIFHAFGRSSQTRPERPTFRWRPASASSRRFHCCNFKEFKASGEKLRPKNHFLNFEWHRKRLYIESIADALFVSRARAGPSPHSPNSEGQTRRAEAPPDKVDVAGEIYRFVNCNKAKSSDVNFNQRLPSGALPENFIAWRYSTRNWYDFL